LDLLIVAAIAYLLGSVNLSILVLRIFGKGDPREWSSGNAGAFNVSRRMGWGWAAPILTLEMAKAAAAAGLGLLLLRAEVLPWIGLALLLGNRYPVFHKFKGGKGVASFLGFAAAINPIFAALSAVAWVVFYKIWREAFIGSFAMVFILTLGILIRCGWTAASISGAIFVMGFIVYSHKKNIAEKFGKKARAAG